MNIHSNSRRLSLGSGHSVDSSRNIILDRVARTLTAPDLTGGEVVTAVVPPQVAMVLEEFLAARGGVLSAATLRSKLMDAGGKSDPGEVVDRLRRLALSMGFALTVVSLEKGQGWQLLDPEQTWAKVETQVALGRVGEVSYAGVTLNWATRAVTTTAGIRFGLSEQRAPVLGVLLQARGGRVAASTVDSLFVGRNRPTRVISDIRKTFADAGAVITIDGGPVRGWWIVDFSSCAGDR